VTVAGRNVARSEWAGICTVQVSRAGIKARERETLIRILWHHWPGSDGFARNRACTEPVH